MQHCSWQRSVLLRHPYLSRVSSFSRTTYKWFQLDRTITTLTQPAGIARLVSRNGWTTELCLNPGSWINGVRRGQKCGDLLSLQLYKRVAGSSHLLTQQRFASDERNYRKSEYKPCSLYFDLNIPLP